MNITHEINETPKVIKLDAPVAAILHAELAQIRKLCEEGNGWCKRDIGRALKRLQNTITA